MTARVILLSVIWLTISPGQSTPRDLLNHLEGPWTMTGTVLKKPVKYLAEGVWVLQGQFFLLHMKDVAVPPAYEANLFMGIDTSKKQFVAHWLDSFGGAGARVVGVGPLSPDTIRIIYPYAERNFRNTFAYDPAKETWTLLIESEQSTGLWSVFAQYTIVKLQKG